MKNVFKFVYLIMQLLLVAPEGGAVAVQSVGLFSGDKTLPLHANKSALLECRYRLDEGETIDELAWIREGRLLTSINQGLGEQVGVVLSNLYLISNPGRDSTGVYTCSVRTQQDTSDTAKFELFVTDILENTYTSSINQKNCSYFISYKTPYAYPRGSAFCGIWLPEAYGGNGAWLEPPPQQSFTETHSSNSSRSTAKLSYSSERREFTEMMDSENRTQFSLHEKKFWVTDTPLNSTIKCTFGFYSRTGRYYYSASIESISHSSYFDSCVEEVPKKFVRPGVSLEFSAYTHDCYGRIRSSQISGDLTAILRCDKSNAFEVLICKYDAWYLIVEENLVQKFDDILEELTESCDAGAPEDDGDNSTASNTGLSLALGTLALVASVRPLLG